MEPILYKYRGIKEFRYLTDIILKKRLFAAKYTDLNDPMEGQYYYNKGELNQNILRKLKDGKDVLRLCSLSKNKNNELMWSHYAEGHRGIAIGVRVNPDLYTLRAVQYTGLAYLQNPKIETDSPTEILCHKLNVWSYEEEERVFVENKNFIDVEVVEINTGRAMSNQDYSFIKELVEKISPNIPIIKAESYM